jgi:sec-independent protein translocase protein TatA
MFEGLFEPMHVLLILIVALVIFGPGKLPDIGKGLGEAIRGFKKALNDVTLDSSNPSEISKAKEETKISK